MGWRSEVVDAVVSWLACSDAVGCLVSVRVCVCVSVCVRARVCARVCVCVCASAGTHPVGLCVRVVLGACAVAMRCWPLALMVEAACAAAAMFWYMLQGTW